MQPDRNRQLNTVTSVKLESPWQGAKPRAAAGHNALTLSSVLRPLQHSIGYMGDDFYGSKDPTNSIKVLKEKAVKENNTKNTKKTEITHMHTPTK